MTNETVRNEGEWATLSEDIMWDLWTLGEPFSADDYYDFAMGHKMPAHLIKKYSGGLFREFSAYGYIRKRKDYILSKRNGSATLPLWERANPKN